MEKKTYLRPALRSLSIDTDNLLTTSLPKTDDEEITDQDQFNSKIWKFMDVNANSAASKQDDEEDNI